MLDSVQLEIRISKSQLILNPRCVICYRCYPKHEEILASCLTLEIREFRCREAKIEVKRSTVTGSQTQDTSGLSHQCSATELQQPEQSPAPTILYMYCTGGTECLSYTPGSHSVCGVRQPLEVNRKIPPSGENQC